MSPGQGGTGVGDHFGTMRHISVTIDRTSPKLLWLIALVIIYKPTKFLVETHRGAGSAGPAGAKKHPRGALKNHPGGALKNHPGGALKNHPGGCGPMEPCARDMRTTGAVRVRPTDHYSRVRATCKPQKPCKAERGPRTSDSEDRGRARLCNHRTTGP